MTNSNTYRANIMTADNAAYNYADANNDRMGVLDLTTI